jgi:hypothetical protein
MVLGERSGVTRRGGGTVTMVVYAALAESPLK